MPPCRATADAFGGGGMQSHLGCVWRARRVRRKAGPRRAPDASSRRAAPIETRGGFCKRVHRPSALTTKVRAIGLSRFREGGLGRRAPTPGAVRSPGPTPATFCPTSAQTPAASPTRRYEGDPRERGVVTAPGFGPALGARGRWSRRYGRAGAVRRMLVTRRFLRRQASAPAPRQRPARRQESMPTDGRRSSAGRCQSAAPGERPAACRRYRAW